MIFGKPLRETFHEDWRPWFAWRPVLLDDGRTAWLEWVERRWVARPEGFEFSDWSCRQAEPLVTIEDR